MAKTKGVKNCTAGNKKCGARCIPQIWDCRLKGEGNNKELAASKVLDPLATLTQIQRGSTRIFKGVSKGNFSEIEGGRKQLIRTVSRNSKGEGGRELTLKEKKEITDRLITGTAILGTVLGVLAGGATAHKILMRAPTYRSRIGNSINNSLNDAQNSLLDSIPLTGNRRGATATAARATGGTAVRLTTPDLKSNRAAVLGGSAQPPSGPGSDVVRQINKIRIDTSRPATQVEAESLKAYLGAKRRVSGDAANPTYINAHAEASALQTISRAYGIEVPNTGRSADFKKAVLAGMETRITAEQFAVSSDLKQRGYTLSNPESKQQYVDDIFGGDSLKEAHARQLLSSKQPSSIAKGIYDSQVAGWGSFYDSMADSIGDDLGRLGRGKPLLADQNDIVQIARVKHAEFLDRNMPVSPGGRINRLNGASTQSSVMKLTAVEYHARKNGARTEWTAPKALVRSAAQELRINTENFNDAFMELSKKFQGLRGEVIFPTGVTRQAKEALTAGFGFTDQEVILNIYKSLRKERSTRVSSVEIMRQAIAKHAANKKRRDSERNDFTPASARQGKPCGKSFIPKSQKCSKSTTASYAQQPNVSPKKGTGKGKGESKTAETLAKIGLATGAVAGAIVGGKKAFKNRKSIGLYAGNSKSIAKGMNNAIVGMNQKSITRGISLLPKQFQGGASKLLGKAKAAAAYVAADVQGFEMKSVNSKGNFSTWSTPDKSRVMNIGSVDDTLIVFNAKQTGKAALRTENGKSVPIYDMDFTTDLGFQQKSGVTRQSGLASAKMIKSMNQATVPELSNNALLKNIPFADDGKGARRASLYKRAGYRSLIGQRGNSQWAMVNNGKVEKIPDGYDSFFDALIRGKSYDEAAKSMSKSRSDSTAPSKRKGQPCGKSYIGKKEKCTKGKGSYAQHQKQVSKGSLINPTSALVTLAASALVAWNVKRIAKVLRSTANKAAGRNLITAQNIVAGAQAGRRAKAQGFDVNHPSNKDWAITDDGNAQARMMPENLKQLNDLGLFSVQRRYSSNKALDLGTAELSKAMRRTKSPEAQKFADAIDRLQIKTDGAVVERMKKNLNEDASDAQSKARVKQFFDGILGNESINFGGLASDSKSPFIKPEMLGDDNFYSIFRTHSRPNRELNYDPDQLQAAVQVNRKVAKKSVEGKALNTFESVYVTTAIGPAKGANADMGIIVHEAMHIMDFNGGDLRRSTNMMKPAKMFDEAKNYGMSQYAGSDWGTYNEFIAESSVYYVFDSVNFKREAPTIYAMIDKIVTTAKRP